MSSPALFRGDSRSVHMAVLRGSAAGSYYPNPAINLGTTKGLTTAAGQSVFLPGTFDSRASIVHSIRTDADIFSLSPIITLERHSGTAVLRVDGSNIDRESGIIEGLFPFYLPDFRVSISVNVSIVVVYEIVPVRGE